VLPWISWRRLLRESWQWMRMPSSLIPVCDTPQDTYRVQLNGTCDPVWCVIVDDDWRRALSMDFDASAHMNPEDIALEAEADRQLILEQVR